jgi:Uma2 family endonuclease
LDSGEAGGRANRYTGLYLGDPDIDFVKLAQSRGVEATRARSPFLVDVRVRRVGGGADSTWHQEIVQRLSEQMRAYLRANQIGHPYLSPADISWGPDILVQPDVFVVDLAEARTLEWAQMTSLLLTIEVLSTSTARHDRFTKRRLYQEVGIPPYWIVDPDQQAVEIWTPDAQFPTVERERLEWHPEGSVESFVLELEELFKPI